MRWYVWLIALFVSLFCGVVGISAIAPLDQVARPFVCGSQQLQVTSVQKQTYQGESYSIGAYCIDNTTGQQVGSDVGGQVAMVSGMIYGLILFFLVAIVFIWIGFWNKHFKKDYRP